MNEKANRQGLEAALARDTRPLGEDLSSHVARKGGSELRNAVGKVGRYELLQELGRGATGIVYEAYDRESGAVVALKTLVSMDAENLFRLKHEFRSLADLEHENLVRFGELGSAGGRLFFTMERIHGPDFLHYVRPAGFDEPRLRDALAQLIEALAALHETGRVHRDVKPSNVLVTDEGRVVLLDFGVTTGFGASDGMTGTPMYMAPEQILGEELTPAADWYAVGVMIYASLSGNVPFAGEVPAILNAKLDVEGAPGDALEGPEDLRALCLALMRRQAAERPGLDEIRTRLGVGRTSGRMREVFVGREAELGRLRDAMARAQTATQSIVVRGEAGMGKSALVERFLSEVRKHALVLRGRCYEQENVPFGGVDSLVDALSEYLLGLSAAEVDRLLVGGVSNVARVFPVLSRVPHVASQTTDGPVLNATTLREQAFGELIRILGALGRAHTLVLFLDDLQWIDDDSLALLRPMLHSSSVRCVFLATLRSETTPSSELGALLEGMESIEISRLSSDESSDVISALATLHGDVRDAVLREAAGHPLFLAELLRSARAGKLEQHANARLQDVLWDRISERDDVERRFLEMAAVAGAPTPYAVLAQAAGLDLGECSTRIAPLRAAQLVRVSRVDDERCVEPHHDRVREAIMERMHAQGEDTVAARHLSLGRALLEGSKGAKATSRIFAIVQHLNLGRRVMESEAERRRLAELNLVATRQAYLSTAFERARSYALVGLEQLGTDGWSAAYPVSRDLRVSLMKAECVLGHRDAARAAFDEARTHLQTPEEKATLYATWIDFETTAGRIHEALASGREVLGQLGTRLPARVTKFHVLTEYAKARWVQRGRSAEALNALQESHDAALQGEFEVLAAMAPPAYFVEPDLLPWTMLRMARMTMQHGVSRWASTGVVGYGMVLTGAFGKREEGAAFGRLGIALGDRFENPRMQAEAHLIRGYFLQPWVQSFGEARKTLQRAYELAVRHGVTKDQIYASLMAANLMHNEGMDLSLVKTHAERARDLGLQRNAEHMANLPDLLVRYAGSLRGERPTLDDPTLARTPQGDFLYTVLQAERDYLFGEHARAESRLLTTGKTEETVFSQAYLVDYWCLQALVAASCCDGAPLLPRRRRQAKIRRLCRKLDAVAVSCRDNFEPHALLARAELARVSGQEHEAADLYARAAASAARAGGSPKREAIARELAMKLAQRRCDAEAASRHRALALDAYRRWGATLKVRALEESSGSPRTISEISQPRPIS